MNRYRFATENLLNRSCFLSTELRSLRSSARIQEIITGKVPNARFRGTKHVVPAIIRGTDLQILSEVCDSNVEQGSSELLAMRRLIRVQGCPSDK